MCILSYVAVKKELQIVVYKNQSSPLTKYSSYISSITLNFFNNTSFFKLETLRVGPVVDASFPRSPVSRKAPRPNR